MCPSAKDLDFGQREGWGGSELGRDLLPEGHVGVCGCGVGDADSDADGVADCTDGCPADGDKVQPGECGCGVVEGSCGGNGAQPGVRVAHYSLASAPSRMPDFSVLTPDAEGVPVVNSPSGGRSSSGIENQASESDHL